MSGWRGQTRKIHKIISVVFPSQRRQEKKLINKKKNQRKKSFIFRIITYGVTFRYGFTPAFMAFAQKRLHVTDVRFFIFYTLYFYKAFFCNNDFGQNTWKLKVFKLKNKQKSHTAFS